MNLVWSVRKAGLSLLTGCIGPAKPVAFIEDAAVRPAQLPEYVRGSAIDHETARAGGELLRTRRQRTCCMFDPCSICTARPI